MKVVFEGTDQGSPGLRIVFDGALELDITTILDPVGKPVPDRVTATYNDESITSPLFDPTTQDGEAQAISALQEGRLGAYEKIRTSLSDLYSEEFLESAQVELASLEEDLKGQEAFGCLLSLIGYVASIVSFWGCVTVVLCGWIVFFHWAAIASVVCTCVPSSHVNCD